jgi:fucose permease
MAERRQAANIANDTKQTNAFTTGFLIGTVMTAAFPIIFAAAAIGLLVAGHDTAAVVSLVITAVSSAPSIAINIRNAFNRPQNPPDGNGNSTPR